MRRVEERARAVVPEIDGLPKSKLSSGATLYPSAGAGTGWAWPLARPGIQW
jgi:hypothetical protein